MPSPPSESEPDSLDLSDWEPDDPVLAEIPDASSEFLASRRKLKAAESRPIEPQSTEGLETAQHPVMKRASFQSDPDQFLKCLAILETALRLRQKQGVELGQPPSTEDLTRLAMSTLQALPIDLEANTGFLVQFVSQTIGRAQQSAELQQLQSDLAASDSNELTGLELKEIVRVDLPTETHEALDTVSEAWGKHPLDLGLGTIKFDEGRAVIEDVQQIPGVGAALISKDGKFRSRFFRTIWWTSLIVALFMLLLVLLSFVRWATPEANYPAEPTLVDEALYMTPNLDLLDVALSGFVRSKSWLDQLDYIRHPNLMERKMQKHFETQPFRWGSDYRLLTAELKIFHGVPQMLCLIELEPSKEQRSLLVEVTQNGDYLLDWEYAEFWQEVPWTEFRQRQEATPANMLVIMKPGKYYNFDYHDNKVYQCWELLDPSEQGLSMFGYARRDSPVGRTLQRLREDRLLTMSHNFLSTVLKLRHPEGSQDPLQVEIMEVIEESALRRH